MSMSKMSQLMEINYLKKNNPLILDTDDMYSFLGDYKASQQFPKNRNRIQKEDSIKECKLRFGYGHEGRAGSAAINTPNITIIPDL